MLVDAYHFIVTHNILRIACKEIVRVDVIKNTDHRFFHKMLLIVSILPILVNFTK